MQSKKNSLSPAGEGGAQEAPQTCRGQEDHSNPLTQQVINPDIFTRSPPIAIRCTPVNDLEMFAEQTTLPQRKARRYTRNVEGCRPVAMLR